MIITERVEINYRLIFNSAFHFGTGLRKGLIHRSVARNRDNYLYVPGSTLKGVLREHCEQLGKLFGLTIAEPRSTDNLTRAREARIQDPDIIFRIFGSRFLPGSLYFDDSSMISAQPSGDNVSPFIDATYFSGPSEEEQGRYKARQVEHRTQVELTRNGRTAKPGHLYTSEYGIRQLGFQGKIYGCLEGFALEESEHGTYSLLLLLAGLLSIDKMGGNKSTGAGQVEVSIVEPGLLIDGQVVSTDPILEQLYYLEYYQIEREEGA